MKYSYAALGGSVLGLTSAFTTHSNRLVQNDIDALRGESSYMASLSHRDERGTESRSFEHDYSEQHYHLYGQSHSLGSQFRPIQVQDEPAARLDKVAISTTEYLSSLSQPPQGGITVDTVSSDFSSRGDGQHHLLCEQLDASGTNWLDDSNFLHEIDQSIGAVTKDLQPPWNEGKAMAVAKTGSEYLVTTLGHLKTDNNGNQLGAPSGTVHTISCTSTFYEKSASAARERLSRMISTDCESMSSGSNSLKSIEKMTKEFGQYETGDALNPTGQYPQERDYTSSIRKPRDTRALPDFLSRHSSGSKKSSVSLASDSRLSMYRSGSASQGGANGKFTSASSSYLGGLEKKKSEPESVDSGYVNTPPGREPLDRDYASSVPKAKIAETDPARWSRERSFTTKSSLPVPNDANIRRNRSETQLGPPDSGSIFTPPGREPLDRDYASSVRQPRGGTGDWTTTKSFTNQGSTYFETPSSTNANPVAAVSNYLSGFFSGETKAAASPKARASKSVNFATPKRQIDSKVYPASFSKDNMRGIQGQKSGPNLSDPGDILTPPGREPLDRDYPSSIPKPRESGTFSSQLPGQSLGVKKSSAPSSCNSNMPIRRTRSGPPVGTATKPMSATNTYLGGFEANKKSEPSPPEFRYVFTPAGRQPLNKDQASFKPFWMEDSSSEMKYNTANKKLDKNSGASTTTNKNQWFDFSSFLSGNRNDEGKSKTADSRVGRIAEKQLPSRTNEPVKWMDPEQGLGVNGNSAYSETSIQGDWQNLRYRSKAFAQPKAPSSDTRKSDGIQGIQKGGNNAGMPSQKTVSSLKVQTAGRPRPLPTMDQVLPLPIKDNGKPGPRLKTVRIRQPIEQAKSPKTMNKKVPSVPRTKRRDNNGYKAVSVLCFFAGIGVYEVVQTVFGSNSIVVF